MIESSSFIRHSRTHTVLIVKKSATVPVVFEQIFERVSIHSKHTFYFLASCPSMLLIP